MADATWRHFNFFNIEQHDELYTSQTKDGPVRRNINAVTFCSDLLIVGDEAGDVHTIDKHRRLLHSHNAYTGGRVTHLARLEHSKKSAVIITLGEDDKFTPLLKIWTLDGNNGKADQIGLLKCTNTTTIQTTQPFPISVLAVAQDGLHIAVGFSSGAITILRGDVHSSRAFKQKTIPSSDEPITGLAFIADPKTSLLYISTTSRILSYIVVGKGAGQPAKLVDGLGCALHCSAVDEQTQAFVVARDDAICYYKMDGRETAYSATGHKSRILLLKSYVVTVSPPSSPSNDALLHHQGAYETTPIHILDLTEKYVAHSSITTFGVMYLVAAWDQLWLLGTNGQVSIFKEKEVTAKLDILQRRNLYTLAIDIASAAQAEPIVVEKLKEQFADYLYGRGDFEGAMKHYLSCIDHVNTSKVIRQYLDGQLIAHLTRFLEELHARKRATSDHTTLLLNCYAKAKEVDRLEAFIRNQSDLDFDIDTALYVCRQARYYDQAVLLAQRTGEHDIYLAVQIDNLKNYKEALNYLRHLPPSVVGRNLHTYGLILLDEETRLTTDLLIDYYSGTFIQEKIPETMQPLPSVSSASYYLPRVSTYAAYIPYIGTTSSATKASSPKSSITSRQNAQGLSAPIIVAPQYQPPRSRAAFALFVNHRDAFIRFLEAMLQKSEAGGQSVQDDTLPTALFEAYLQTAAETTDASQKEHWEAKAREMLMDLKVPINQSNAMLLSYLAKYEEGTNILYKQAGLNRDMFQRFMARKDTAKVIETLEQSGSDEVSLYPLALTYFCSTPEILAESKSEVAKVLDHIIEKSLMTPLQVVQILSKTDVATLGLVKSFMSRTIERERREIGNNRKLIESYRNETSTKQQEIQDILHSSRVFQGNRCASCGGHLDLPVVHFMCKHSFHQRCLPDDDTDDQVECPHCSSQNATMRAMRVAQDEMADRHDIFKATLRDSRDKFRVVADFIAKGVLLIRSKA